MYRHYKHQLQRQNSEQCLAGDRPRGVVTTSVCPRVVLINYKVSPMAKVLGWCEPLWGCSLHRAMCWSKSVFGRSAPVVFDAARVESWLDEGGATIRWLGK